MCQVNPCPDPLPNPPTPDSVNAQLGKPPCTSDMPNRDIRSASPSTAPNTPRPSHAQNPSQPGISLLTRDTGPQSQPATAPSVTKGATRPQAYRPAAAVPRCVIN